MFTNPSVQSTIEEFSEKCEFNGFGMNSSPYATYYYVTDWEDEVYILNDEWKLISSKFFDDPVYMISIGNSLYMTGEKNVWKLDQHLNILINHEPTGSSTFYKGISYNPSNELIYVVSSWLKEIQVFNMDLTLIRRFSTLPHEPWSITISSNKLYVGTEGGMILVYQNEMLINKFDGSNRRYDKVTSILFDQNGYMATSCDNPASKLYLYSPDGSFTGKSMDTCADFPSYIGFDSKGRFIQISAKRIRIYN